MREHENICTCADESAIKNSKENMPQDEVLYDLADCFKVFGDSTRIKILFALLRSDLCVGELVEILDMTQSAISHQLRVLRQNGLVKYKKDGKTIIYSLDDGHVFTLLNEGLAHILHKRGEV